VTIGRKYAAFWSYTRFDDKNDAGWLTALREAPISEVQALFGKQVEIFQDIDGMAWGERWKRKLVSSSDDAVFLIPIITPSYFASEPCREELKQFVDRENGTRFKELILPIYYIDTRQLKDQFEKATDLLAQTVAEHHYIDITKLRHRSITSYEAKQEIQKLATALFERLRGYARKQLSAPAMQAHFHKTAQRRKSTTESVCVGDSQEHPGGDRCLVGRRNRCALPSARSAVTDRQRIFSSKRNHWPHQR
jgi:TIR domain